MIEVANLYKRFDTIEAVRGVSFRVASGEVFGLLGPNGAGKSTTIAMLCGLVKPDAGTARIDGLDVAARPAAARQRLGVVPQEPSLYGDLSGRDNLLFFGRLYGLRGSELRERVDAVLTTVNLLDRAGDRVEQYSGGMVRRLNIAAGVLHRPKAVLMDEPTVGLDPQTRVTILQLVRQVARDGAAVLYTTHYLDEAEHLCDRLAIVDHGVILAEGALEQLKRAAGEREIVALRGTFRPDAVPAAIGQMREVQLIHATDRELLFTTDSAERQLSSLLALVAPLGDVREVAIRQPSLENLFIKLTGRELRE